MRTTSTSLRWYRLWWLAGSLSACGSGAAERPETTTPKDSAVVAAPVAGLRSTVVLVGTSLTAGYGLDPSQSWATLLQARVDSVGLPFRIINAGVSGETSAGALRRTDWLFSQGPIRVLVVETGANDGLRGQPIDSLRSNLEQILTRAEALVPKPVLVVAGMEAPPNLGRRYADDFRAVFPAAAKAHGAVYLPFLLDGVAGVEALNQADGIHPNPRGSRRVLDNVWTTLRPILDSLSRRPPP